MNILHDPYPWQDQAYTWRQLRVWRRRLTEHSDYETLRLRGASPQELIEAGYFDEGDLAQQDSSPLLAWPTTVDFRRLEKLGNCTLVCLVTTGSFAPAHAGHLAMMRAAHGQLMADGHAVIGAYYSPSHDLYVQTKDGGSASTLKARWRVEHLRHLIAETPSPHDVPEYVDTWESQGIDRPVNFTRVVRHLQASLEAQTGRRVAMVYVFGSDNQAFSRVWPVYAGRVIPHACYTLPVFRPGHEGENSLTLSSGVAMASRTIRRLTTFPAAPGGKVTVPSPFLMGVRDDLEETTRHWGPFVSEEDLHKALSDWKTGVIGVLEQVFGSYDPDRQTGVLVKDFRETWKELLAESSDWVSLDRMTPSSVAHLPISREFLRMDAQHSCQRRLVLNNTTRFDPGLFTRPLHLLDDDAVTGQSFVFAREWLEQQGVQVHPQPVTLWGRSGATPQDVVDLRDFLPGALHGGLVVQVGHGRWGRAPYLHPWVNLHRRANFPLERLDVLDQELRRLALTFFQSLPVALTLDQSDPMALAFWESLGFSRKTTWMEALNATRLRG